MTLVQLKVILFIVFGVLVQRVIRQMHKHVVEVAALGSFISFSAEPSESHLVQVDSQRIHSVEEHIQTQIIFQIIDQMWLINILLHDVTDALLVNVVLFQSLVVFGFF